MLLFKFDQSLGIDSGKQIQGDHDGQDFKPGGVRAVNAVIRDGEDPRKDRRRDRRDTPLEEQTDHENMKSAPRCSLIRFTIDILPRISRNEKILAFISESVLKYLSLGS